MKRQAVFAIGAVALTVGCATPRPPESASHSCNLQPTVLRIEMLPNGQEAAPANPFLDALRTAAHARSTEVPTEGAAGEPRFKQLVLSGGGQHGSFGAGFLQGMPDFPDYDIVTGVSTGALQAPFALIGKKLRPADRSLSPQDDFPADANAAGRTNRDDIVAGYSISRQSSLYNHDGELAAIRKARLGDLEPLRRRLNSLVTDGMLKNLANLGAGKGLYIALLNWDTGNAEVVDMLKLARRSSTGDASARGCFIDVMVAASSEPIGAPPVMMDGNLYVDAGLRYGVFLNQIADAASAFSAQEFATLPEAIRGRMPPIVRTDMIRNGDLEIPVERPAKYSVLTIAGRARKILVNQIYGFSMAEVLQSARNGHQVRFAYIRKDEMGAGPVKGAEFDPAYMARMIEVGRRRSGHWDLDLP